MGLHIIIFLILFGLGIIFFGYGSHERKGLFAVWGSLFLLMAAAGIVFFGGIDLETVYYYDSAMNLLSNTTTWAYSDTLLFWFTNALFVLAGVGLFSMVGSNSIASTETDVYHW